MCCRMKPNVPMLLNMVYLLYSSLFTKLLNSLLNSFEFCDGYLLNGFIKHVHNVFQGEA